MKVNRRKTEYMRVNERQDTGSGTVKMQGERERERDRERSLFASR